MNKKILLIILLLFIPFIINAKECDKAKHEEYVGLAPSITFDNNYSKGSGKFSIIIYNIFEGMYAQYNNKKYEPNEGNTVEINDIKQGSSVLISIFADDGCDEIKIISKSEPYYNEYYESAICEGHEEIKLCSSQFTEAPVSEDIIKSAIENYGKSHQSIPGDKVQEEKESFLDVIKEYIQKWGIKVLLVVVTIFLASSLFNSKFRKIKHGI